MNTSWRRGAVMALGWAFALSVGLGGSFARAGCASAELDGPLRLPDGSLHPAGKLTLCASAAYSPVAALHRTYVNRRPVGLLLGRRGVSEGQDARGPFMMFLRQPDGSLWLYGYALPEAGSLVTYLLGDPRAGRRARAGRTGAAATVPSPAVPSVLLAAAPIRD